MTAIPNSIGAAYTSKPLHSSIAEDVTLTKPRCSDTPRLTHWAHERLSRKPYIWNASPMHLRPMVPAGE